MTDLTGSFLPPFFMSLGFLVLGIVLAFFMRPDIAVAESRGIGKVARVAG